ncbi:MAG: hypothetical protein V4787_01200 [Pseudomonadota bacterium]
MKRLLAMPSVQIALCLAVFAWGAWKFGPAGAAITSPLLGAAICRPLMAWFANIRHAAREHVWLPVHGQHYVFKGVTIKVVEDDRMQRWVRLADVRKAVGETAGERALAITYPGRFEAKGDGGLAWLRADALVEHLAKLNEPTALRMRTWVEREVEYAARRLRERAGIRDEAPEAD